MWSAHASRTPRSHASSRSMMANRFSPPPEQLHREVRNHAVQGRSERGEVDANSSGREWSISLQASPTSGLQASLVDVERVGAVVAMTEPAGTDADVGDVRVLGSLAPFRVLLDVGAQAAFAV